MSLNQFSRVVMAIALAATASGAASANGYLFFHEHQHDSDTGTVYLGSVTDTAGKPLPGAQVSLDVMSFNQSLSFDTDARGRYRSNGLSNNIDPKQVKVSVIKPGYKLIKSVNMSRARKPGQPVEINFILAKG
ncbi:carboxypeptidase-like regulatory domain-containing protein [Sphingomonas montanisoli]|uniref:Carboxypeptidase regulatory-like domain-containing protein n=1 Tax=Sphingomonas montanisoli TaxID=2606412 RepID=A0A5D9CAT7_9SPHN|nr:carboxypeptidase-like regulatory domain-containing protein [Sphingomonas montanisoli]TZG27221.1 carboxypeptidase regulatory-like domain-containing protein [Sphingomonas montanisoli]